MNFKIVIPARFASTRFPGKPLHVLAGKTMLEHAYGCAVASDAEEVIIATDDARIQATAEDFGATVCMTSPLHPSGSDRLAEVITLMGWDDEVILVNLQGDEPLTPVSLIHQVAENLNAHPVAGIATLAAPITEIDDFNNPNIVKVVRDRAGFALYFSRAAIPFARDQQGQCEAALRHIGMYAYRAGFLKSYAETAPCDLEHIEKLEQLRALWMGYRIHVDLAAEIPAHGVDTPEDAKKVEALLAQ